MSAEEYHDVPGIGGPTWTSYQNSYQCKNCQGQIFFKAKKAFNKDGSPHLCLGKKPENRLAPQEAVLYAMAAMNAIVNAQIQAGGVDFIHHMNFYDVADAAWRLASAMHSSEKNFRGEFE